MKTSKRVRPADFGSAPSQTVTEATTSPLSTTDTPSFQSPVATAGSAVRASHRADAASDTDPFAPPPAWPVYLIALAVSVMWAFAPIAFAVGYRNAVAPLQNDSFAMAVFALLAIGPAVFVWACAYMIRQGQKLGAEARRTKATADGLLAPALVAAAQAGDVVQSVRIEIERASLAAIEAQETLMALRATVAEETQRLVEATALSARSAGELAGSLRSERTEMGVLSAGLDMQAARVVDAIGQQAKMVAEASDLAETQLREAEATLAARAADLAAAAGEAGDAARVAGEDLTRHIARLETAGLGVAEQVRAVEGGLSDHRTALVAVAQALRTDHSTFSTEAEAHAAKLSEFITQTRLSAMEMSDRATKGGESLRLLMADAAEQFRDLAETARAEREEFGQSTLQSLDAVSEAASRQRRELEAQTRAAIDALSTAAEETRAATGRHAMAAREQVDQLSEAAFAAGQKANQVFESRLEEARALVAESAQMVEAAGAVTARKLDDGARAARATLDELKAMMGEIDDRAASLPDAARGQVEQVRAAVAQGMDELMDQARRTAHEAQAIDAAFQERVRRNFEMLSEAVRLMGAVAAAPPPAAEPQQFAERLEPSPRRKAKASPAPSEEEPLELDQPAKPSKPAPNALELGLRTRLRLTPTQTDQDISSVFTSGPATRVAKASTTAEAVEEAEEEVEGEAWTWKDLLASLDGADGVGERLEDILSGELAKMGVEPAKLLPKGRVEEIAAVVQTGDVDGARTVVKRLAPAATRRIARRLFTDEQVRRQVEVYVRRYQTLVDDAMVRDPEGLLMANLLGGDAGRLYLLLDAAAGGHGLTISLEARSERWPLAAAFVISRGSKTAAEVVVVTLRDGEMAGRGEAVPYARYGESIESVLAQIAGVADAIRSGAGRSVLQGLLRPGAARNALDCALWDLDAKRAGVRAWVLAGVGSLASVTTGFTLSLGSPAQMAQSAAAHAHRPFLKLKIGGPDDLDRVAAVRGAAPESGLIVDANEALDFDELRRLAPEFARLGVGLIEQPLPAHEDGQLEGYVSPVPLCADESLHSRAELDVCARRYGCVNIKLDKAGGLTEALALNAAARARGLAVMVGSMVGTSLGVAPAMILAQDATYVDLDGPLLLTRDREGSLKGPGSVLTPPSAALWG